MYAHPDFFIYIDYHNNDDCSTLSSGLGFNMSVVIKPNQKKIINIRQRNI